MKILSTFKQIQDTLKQVKPYSIAVAYVGEDYDKFINPKKLKEIIVSPTIGSNPKAISSIVKTLDWDKVHFLDNLHSKIYIGKNSAIIGSPNLSRNALDVNGLFETAILIQDKQLLNELNQLFDFYKAEAYKHYPRKDSKLRKLQDLYNERKRIPLRYSGKNKSIISYVDYRYGVDEKFKIIWYEINEWDDSVYNKNKILADIMEREWNIFKSSVTAELDFHPKDLINENEWLLCFELGKKGQCLTSGIEWFYIDKKIKNAYNVKNATTGVFQFKKSKSIKPPFRIDKSFRTAFSKVINQDKYKVFRLNNYGQEWLVKKTITYMDDLMSDIKKEYDKH